MASKSSPGHLQPNAVLATTLACLAAGALLLLRFPPELYHFYPRCPIRSTTGLLCPGCGATRALTLLLHGNLLDALRQNALFVLLLPCVTGYFLLAYRRAVAGKSWPRLPPTAVLALLTITVAFTLYRNLA